MTFLDRILGRKELAATPAQVAKEDQVTPPKTGEIGWAETMLYGGKDFPKYNPDALLANKGGKIYKKMMLDDQVKACLRFKQYTVISRDFHFDVAEDEDGQPDPAQQEMSDFFEAVIAHLRGSFIDKLIEILSAMENGFSITEKVYEPFTWDGRTWWGLRDLKTKPFDSFNGGFTLDEYGNILKLEQRYAAAGIEIPLDKVIHFVHQPDIDRVYGESDLKACYRNYWSKDVIIKLQNIHLERHASGFIWAKVSGQIGDQQTNLERLMKNISGSMSAIVPEAVTLNQMNPINTDAFEKAIALHDKGISKSLLVPNLLGLSEQGSVGSYSQSQTQLDAFFWILEQIACRLAETLNEQVFRELAVWNFGTEEFPPFTFAEMSEEKKAAIAETWSNLVSRGSVTRSDSDEAYLRRLMGFPEKAEEEEEPIIVPGQDPLNPEDPLPDGPGSDEELPDNETWINEQPEEKRSHIRAEFASKPWMRRVDFTAIKSDLDRYDGRLTQDMASVMGRVRLSIEQQISKIAGKRSLGNVKPKEFEAVYIPAPLLTELRKSLRGNLQDVLDKAYASAKRELPKKKLADIKYRPGMDKTQAERFLSSRAMKITGVLQQKTLQAVQTVLENGIRYDKSLPQVLTDMGENTDLVSMLPKIDAAGRAVNMPARLETIARTNTSYAMNEARQALFTGPDMRGFVEAFEYSAILDDRVSDICEALDGKVEKDWASYTPPNHFNCRSLLVPVTQVDDWDGKEDTLPNITPQKGFM